jgi:hypothetical protein
MSLKVRNNIVVYDCIYRNHSRCLLLKRISDNKDMTDSNGDEQSNRFAKKILANEIEKINAIIKKNQQRFEVYVDFY